MDLFDELKLFWYGLFSNRNEKIRKDIVTELRAIKVRYGDHESEEKGNPYTRLYRLEALVDSPRYKDDHVVLVIEKMIEDDVLETLETDRGTMARLKED